MATPQQLNRGGIRIVTDRDLQTPSQIKVFASNGAEIDGILKLTIFCEPGDVVRAEMDVLVNYLDLDGVKAEFNQKDPRAHDKPEPWLEQKKAEDDTLMRSINEIIDQMHRYAPPQHRTEIGNVEKLIHRLLHEVNVGSGQVTDLRREAARTIAILALRALVTSPHLPR